MYPCSTVCWFCDPTSCVLLVSVRRVAPRFSIPPSNHEVMPGGSVNLTCVAVGAPMPYVKWMAGVEELTKEDEMPVGRNVLELNNIMQSANYTCVAISSLGMIEATAQITVKGKELLLVALWFQQCSPLPKFLGCSPLTALSVAFPACKGGSQTHNFVFSCSQYGDICSKGHFISPCKWHSRQGCVRPGPCYAMGEPH